jgi:hypothetical protein
MKNISKIFAIFAVLAFLSVPASAQQSNSGIGAGANADANANAEAGASSGSNSSIDSHDVNTAVSNRDFNVPGNYQFGPVLNYYGKQTPSVGYQDVRTIIMYSCMFSEGALEKMSSGVIESGMAEFKLINGDDIVAPAKAAADGTRWIKVVVSLEALKGAALKGHVSGEAQDRELTMVELLADVALKALKNGANTLHITAFGATHDVFSSGWGIGFNTTLAAIDDLNKGQNRSIVGGGGLGYSSAKAGSRDQGWIQAFALVDSTLVYPESPKKPVVAQVKTETTQTGNHIPKK